jgi:hypothetical protein
MNTFPDIYYDNNNSYNNPMIFSPNAPYAICFYQTIETLNSDGDTFKNFLENSITRFRHSVTYTHYKEYLYDIGLDRCQVMSNILADSKKVHIEMHHNGLTIFDVALLLTNHILMTKGKISTFDLVLELKKVHKANKVPLVMLCRTAHQMVHNNDEFFVPASMCFGFWMELITEYKFGLTYGLAKKIYYFIKTSLEHENDPELNKSLLTLNENILKWSEYNECALNNNKINNVINNQEMH